jgi:radical SAM protein with 4Fe4S-binding SPASM domain
MFDKTTKLNHSGIFIKTEHSNDYVPQKPSKKALICLDCDPNKNCEGDCGRFRTEYKKLKEQQNGI